MLHLFLVYIDILRIENLWQFEKLTSLQLDNNVIEKIESLDNLKNLIWLGNFFVVFHNIFGKYKYD